MEEVILVVKEALDCLLSSMDIAFIHSIIESRRVVGHRTDADYFSVLAKK